MHAVTKIALVGGTPNVSSFQDHLEEWGLDVCAHIPHLPLRVPREATHLIVLKTHCSHSLYHAAQKVAKRRGLVLCAVEQNWSQAESMLQEMGVLPEASIVETMVTSAPVPAPAHQGLHIGVLQSQVVRLEDQLRQTEDMVLERDDLLLGMGNQLNLLAQGLKALESQTNTTVYMAKAQRAALAVDRLMIERRLANHRKGWRRDLNPVKRGKATELAGGFFGVSGELVRQAEKVFKCAPEVFKAMKEGLLRSVSQALRLAQLPLEDRTARLADLSA